MESPDLSIVVNGMKFENPFVLGSGMTKKSLYPAEAEDVILEIDMPDPGLLDGSIPVFVVVDDGMPMHTWKECRTTNNKVEGSGFCAMPG